MKRIGGLFDRIHAAPALAAAAWRAAAGKRSRPEVRAFFADFEAHVAQLGAALRDGSHRFGPYTSFAIRDPKSRTIRAPSFGDRVVHHAMVAAVGPVLERGALPTSHACRVGKGQRAALGLARDRVRHAEAFLKLDVAKLYDSVDHDLLRTALRRRLREERLLALFDRLLASYEASPGKGLPIGALTSQYLGNFYLDGIDRWLAAQPEVMGYQRYMDDMLCFGRFDALRALRRRAIARIACEALRVKDGGVLNRCVLGVPWLGFTLYPDRVRLAAPGRQRLGRRLGALERAFDRGRIGEGELQARATALFAHAQHADDTGFRRALLARRAKRFREVLEPGGPRGPRRLVEQFGQEVPVREPQQEEAGQSQRQPGLPGLLAPRHDGALRPTDDAPSGALTAALAAAGDEASGRTPAGAEIQRAESPAEKAPAGAPPSREGR